MIFLSRTAREFVIVDGDKVDFLYKWPLAQLKKHGPLEEIEGAEPQKHILPLSQIIYCFWFSCRKFDSIYRKYV